VRDRRGVLRHSPQLDAPAVPVRDVHRGRVVRSPGQRHVHGGPRLAGGDRGGAAPGRHALDVRRPRHALAARLPRFRGAGSVRVPGAEAGAVLLRRVPRAHLELPGGVGHQRGLGRGAVRGALHPLTAPAPRPGASVASGQERSRRLRAPLLLALWALLGFEAAGGLLIFFARVAWGSLPGETLHVLAGALLTAVYAAYQWRHWVRVRPFRSRLGHALGLIAPLSLSLPQLSGLALGRLWWQHRAAGPVPYPPPLSAAHNITSMLTMTFALSHLGAVLVRDRRAGRLAGQPAGPGSAP